MKNLKVRLIIFPIIIFIIEWEIEVNEHSFNLINMFGKPMKYNYNEVSIKNIRSWFGIYKGNKYILGLG